MKNIRLFLLVILTVIFFASMAWLTANARSVHENSLPHVTAKRISREMFSGSYTRRLAVPKELFDTGDVFVISVRIVNGEKRNFARRVFIETVAENDEFYEVIEGLTGNELIIVESDRGFGDGDEVYLVK